MKMEQKLCESSDLTKAGSPTAKTLSSLPNTMSKWLPAYIPRGSLKDIFIGNYDYSYLFIPRWPYCRTNAVERAPPFFAVNEPLPILLAIIMGFQHAAAMVPGIVLGPLIIAASNPNKNITQYLIEVALMASGIGTILHVIQLRIPFTKYVYGTGLVSVVGITTTQAAVGLQSIADQLKNGGSWNDAYGSYLGTVMVCSFATTIVSFFPRKLLQRLFPTYIAGLTVFLVGVYLCGVEITNWGGGFACTNGPTGDLCSGNGSAMLPFGSIQYLGLGAVSFVVLFLIEMFGSPIMRNCEVILAFLIAYCVASFVRHDGDKFIDPTDIHSSSNGTFFWVHTFKLGIYPGAILPFIIGFLADAATAIGDLSATEEVSAVETEGPKHDERVQGCLLADGFNCFLAALATSMPVNVFAQNNGIIAFSNCASRVAGICCGIWLFLCGVIGKIGAFFTYAPNCVIGGITTFLFGSIAVSGIMVMTSHAVDRRRRFVLSVAAAIGLGISLKPDIFTNHLWLISDTAPVGLKMIQQSITIVLSTGYVAAWLIAMVLDNILPHETDPADRLRQIAMKDGGDITGKEAHMIEEEIHKSKDHKMVPLADDETMIMRQRQAAEAPQPAAPMTAVYSEGDAKAV